MKNFFISNFSNESIRVKLVKIQHIHAEVRDQCLHLLLVTEADVWNEFHESLQKDWMASYELTLCYLIRIQVVRCHRTTLRIHCKFQLVVYLPLDLKKNFDQ